MLFLQIFLRSYVLAVNLGQSTIMLRIVVQLFLNREYKAILGFKVYVKFVSWEKCLGVNNADHD